MDLKPYEKAAIERLKPIQTIHQIASPNDWASDTYREHPDFSLEAHAIAMQYRVESLMRAFQKRQQDFQIPERLQLVSWMHGFLEAAELSGLMAIPVCDEYHRIIKNTYDIDMSLFNNPEVQWPASTESC